MKQRNATIDICKGLAIIAMVVGHADCPGHVLKFVYLWHMPLFFITAGYFFSRRNLTHEWEFVKHRIKGLYVPFVKWTSIMILLNPLFFATGILNEQYGNMGGGVTHPMNVHKMVQALVDCFTTMGGYDEFILSAFWFLRALLVGSICFLLLFKLLDKVPGVRRSDEGIVACICAIMLLCSYMKYGYGIQFKNINQGGYREMMCVFFMGIGYLFHRHEARLRPMLRWAGWLLIVPLLWFTWHWFACLSLSNELHKVWRVPVVATVGFLFIHTLSDWLSRHGRAVARLLSYTGRNSLQVMTFHILAFKAVCIPQVLLCGLPWGMIGCHMVVHHVSTYRGLWLVYVVAGVAIPLLGKWMWDKVRRKGTHDRVEEACNRA